MCLLSTQPPFGQVKTTWYRSKGYEHHQTVFGNRLVTSRQPKVRSPIGDQRPKAIPPSTLRFCLGLVYTRMCIYNYVYIYIYMVYVMCMYTYIYIYIYHIHVCIIHTCIDRCKSCITAYNMCVCYRLALSRLLAASLFARTENARQGCLTACDNGKYPPWCYIIYYIYIYIYIYIHIHTQTHVHIYTYTCVCIYIYRQIDTHVYTHIIYTHITNHGCLTACDNGKHPPWSTCLVLIAVSCRHLYVYVLSQLVQVLACLFESALVHRWSVSMSCWLCVGRSLVWSYAAQRLVIFCELGCLRSSRHGALQHRVSRHARREAHSL